MKGIIFNLLENFITDVKSESLWHEVYASTKLEDARPYVGPETYPDEDLFSLVITATQKLEMPVNKALFLFGKYTFKPLSEIHPHYLDGIKSASDFLMIVDQVIHVEVKKLMPEAYLPKLLITKNDDDSISIHYESKRKLCHFLEGLISGCAEYFGEEVEITHPVCAHEGYTYCLLNVAIWKKP